MRLELAEQGTLLCARLHGPIDGDADLSPLSQTPAAELLLDLSAVRMITSAGVVCWLRFVRELPASKRVRLAGCPVSFINQLDLIPDFLGPAVVETLFVPYLCPSCDLAENVLTSAASLCGGSAPPVGCSRCGKQMEPDVIEQQYFGFLRP